MRSFIHFLSLKGIQEDVNKSFSVAMDNAGLNEYFVSLHSFYLSNKKTYLSFHSSSAVETPVLFIY